MYPETTADRISLRVTESFEDSSSTSLTGVGTRSNKFRVLYELGRGGMARVYLAERVAHGLNKLVVLKVMDPTLAMDESMRGLFRKEALICARLNHPNIVQVYEVLDDFKLPTMVMEYIDGVAFSQILQAPEDAFPLRLRVHVLVQVLAALHYFHELEDSSGILLNAIHRDVTPQNVIVMHAGVVKVLDFGVAKIRTEGLGHDETQTGVVKGKLKYMPKEQVMADSTIDRRADIFAVGVMLWETLSQQRMWAKKSPPEIYQALLTDKIPNIREVCPNISPQWEHIIARATAPNRVDRYATALEMQLAIERAMEELGGLVRQRELAECMQAQFGSMRAEQATKLENERKRPPLPIMGLEASMAHTMHGSTLTIESTQLLRRKRRTVFLAAIVPLSLLSIGGLLYPSFEHLLPWTDTQQAAIANVAPIELSISAFPPQAVIEIDGQRVGNPMTRHFIPSGERRSLKITAEGHSPQTRELVLDRSMNLEVRLAPITSAPSKEGEPVPVELDALGTVAEPSPEPQKPATGLRPQPVRPQARSAPQRKVKSNCNPPYTIGADGVKTFKLECI